MSVRASWLRSDGSDTVPAERTVGVRGAATRRRGLGSFGWLPVRDTDPDDGSARLAFDWANELVNVICHRSDEVPRTGGGLVCKMMFCHMAHTQALLVFNGTAVAAVAPPNCPLNGPADADQVKAFVLKPHDALVLHQRIWHWGRSPSTALR